MSERNSVSHVYEMRTLAVTNRETMITARDEQQWTQSMPPSWRQFIELCRNIRHGELERVAIQDGVPVLAELTRQKVKFGTAR